MKYIKPQRRNLSYKPNRTKVFMRKTTVLFGLILKLLFVGAISFGAYYFVFRSGFFNIKDVNIDISGDTKFLNTNDFKSLAKSNLTGKNILLLNVVATEDLLKNNFLVIKNVSVTKHLPDYIDISVKERVPLALIYNKSDKSYYMVDEEGFVIGAVSNDFNSLPKISYEDEVLVGNFINKNIVPVYLELIDNLNKEKLKASSMSMNSKFSTLYLENDVQVMIGNTKDKVDAFATISSLLKKLTLEGKKVQKIDLRYDKVIVSYE